MGFVSPHRDVSAFDKINTAEAESPVSAPQARTAAAVPSQAGRSGDMQDRVKGAHSLFLSRTHQKLLRAAEIASAMDDPAAPEHRATLSELQDIAHSIAGNAGSFGYQRLSEIAEKLEAAIDMERFNQDLIFDHVIAMASEFLATRHS